MFVDIFDALFDILFLSTRNMIFVCRLQYKTVLTPPPDYLASLANMTDVNGTEAGNMTAGKPSMIRI